MRRNSTSMQYWTGDSHSMPDSAPLVDNTLIDEKRALILAYEEVMAGRLARQVFEKPVPPLWMILIPVFFVFYAWKLKEYSRGLKVFADHYLVSRRRALDAAFEAVRSGTDPLIERLVDKAEALPAQALPLYRDWISQLVEHYRNLLIADGKSVEDLIRGHYRHKNTYLMAVNRLRSAEQRFNSALLPEIEGDREDVLYIAGRMNRGLAELSRKEVESVFSSSG